MIAGRSGQTVGVREAGKYLGREHEAVEASVMMDMFSICSAWEKPRAMHGY